MLAIITLLDELSSQRGLSITARMLATTNLKCITAFHVQSRDASSSLISSCTLFTVRPLLRPLYPLPTSHPGALSAIRGSRHVLPWFRLPQSRTRIQRPVPR